MPRISREQWFFDGEQIYKVVNVTSSGEFNMPVPQKCQDLVGAPAKVYGDTKEEVEKKWKHWLREFTDAKTATRKVILFKTQSNASFRVGEEWFSSSDFHFAKGIVVGVTAGVFEEELVTKSSGKHFNYDQIESEIPSSMKVGSHDVNYGGKETEFHVMEWTEERELFFVKLGMAMQDMIWNVHQFLSSELLVAMIDAGKTPLLGGGEK